MKTNKFITLQVVITSILIFAAIFASSMLFNKNKEISKKVSLQESMKRMEFNINNTIKTIENEKELYTKIYNDNLGEELKKIHYTSSFNEINSFINGMRDNFTIYSYCTFIIYDNLNKKVLSEFQGETIPSSYNGDGIGLEKTVSTKLYTIKIILPEAYIYEHVLESTRANLHSFKFSPNEYIWINHILNYHGGNNYAARLVHPNIITSEGSFLSTFAKDKSGASPYQTELDGVIEAQKSDKGFFQDYFFKNKVNDLHEKKLSYARLYKPYNWILATGIPYNDIYHSVDIIYDEIINIAYGIILIFCVLIVSVNYILFAVYKKDAQTMISTMAENSKQKDIFFAKMSHDMRTPMNGIIGTANIMKSEANNNPELLHHLGQLEISANYLKGLIEDILDIQCLDLHKVQLASKPIQITEIIESIKTNAATSAKERNVQFTCVCNTKNLPRILGDETRLSQIAINLISNAIKFTPSGGTVETVFSFEEQEDNVLLASFSVKDTGIGIEQKALSHIFTPFFQEANASLQNYGGTGLGLSITKNLVELMHGTISLTSEKDKGTTFVVQIPLLIAPEQEPKQNATDYTVLAGKNVLYCEDNALNALICKKLLTNIGMNVISAENGKIGLERFENSQEGYFSCVLMDIFMPEMDGLEATQKIRALPRPDAPVVPIIAVSANAFDTDIAESLAAGMNAHISKPIDVTTLYNTILQLVEKA